jgi:AbrB family looped-hinge helix DNA binding protein
MKAVVTSKGQVTIPSMIRTKAKISPGTELDFQIEEDGSLKVCLVTQDISSLKGMIKSKKNKPVSLKEMKKAIREAAKETMK